MKTNLKNKSYKHKKLSEINVSLDSATLHLPQHFSFTNPETSYNSYITVFAIFRLNKTNFKRQHLDPAFLI